MQELIVGARSSPLSRIQVEEVLNELRQFGQIAFKPIWLETHGDQDQKTSLRSLGKTDFFTREVDQLLLSNGCRIAIHSAKDLPEPLPKGLLIAALTKGVSPKDALVLRSGDQLAKLAPGSKIATSSERREEVVRSLRSDLLFVDIRGTIGQRLEKLNSGEVDGVVIAEAALIRLGLTQLNYQILPGDTTPYQGQLAILARSNDMEMRNLFAPLDTRPSLCLGLSIPKQFQNRKVILKPIIETQAIEGINQLPIEKATHLIFTSKAGVDYFFGLLKELGLCLKGHKMIVVGQATAKRLETYGGTASYIAERESAEGVIELLETLDLKNSHLLWPHSTLSRGVIPEYCSRKNIRLTEMAIYTTRERRLSEPLENYAEIIFTSSSCVNAFLGEYRNLPKDKWLNPIGEVTAKSLTY